MIFNLTFNDIQVWKNSLEYGSTGIIIAVIITLMIAEALIFSIIGIISLIPKNETLDYYVCPVIIASSFGVL